MNDDMFVMVQNWNKEYPELEPYMVLDFVGKNEGFSRCDENGMTAWVPTAPHDPKMHFLPANDDVLWAFLGEKEEIKGKTFLVVRETSK